jgi:hypothetical protein
MRVGAPADPGCSQGASAVSLSGRNGLATSSLIRDGGGNGTLKTLDGVTTTYGYDALGTRVLQTGTTTTYIYPFKWYSVASSTGSGAKYATTTDYVFNGDTLLATVDQHWRRAGDRPRGPADRDRREPEPALSIMAGFQTRVALAKRFIWVALRWKWIGRDGFCGR